MEGDGTPTPGVEILPPYRPTALQTVEATMSVFFAFVVGFVLLTFGGLIAFTAKAPDFNWLLPVWCGAVLAEGVFLFWLKSSLEFGLRPFAPEFALRQIRWPVLLRPVVLA